MNQILQMGNNKRNSGPIEIGKIIKFFSIAIAIFAVILIGVGAYYLIRNNKNTNTKQPQVSTAPSVNITKQDNDLLVEVTGNTAISKIVYNWNNEQDVTIQGENSTSITKTIDLPIGTNTLNLTVTDINGEETKFQKEYVVDGNGKPVVELKLTTDYKIRIKVQDTTGLQYINYYWNNDEPIKVEAKSENPNVIEEIIEIPLGQNTLKVEAVNKSNVTSTKELEVKGVKRPKLSFTKEGDYLVIKVEDEIGMKVVQYTLNGKKYQIVGGNKKYIEYKQEIQKGENNMEISAENIEDGITTKKVKIIN